MFSGTLTDASPTLRHTGRTSSQRSLTTARLGDKIAVFVNEQRRRWLRQRQQRPAGRVQGGRTLLSLGLEPYAGGWRASAPYVTRTQAVLDDPVAALPHYPMVLHRGGWPDGS